MKRKILCILHMPPPVTGAGMVGSFVRDSTTINETFNADYINLSSSSNLDSIGEGGADKILSIFKILIRVIRALLKNNYSICYMTMTAKGPGFYKDLLVVTILKLFGNDIIYHFHNKGVEENSESGFNRMLYRFVFRDTQSILLSPELYPDIASYVKIDDAHFCPNGIPDVMPVTRKLSDDNSPCRFFFLSNMMKQKGVYVLLEACKVLKDKNVPFECHFVGAWADVSEVKFRQTVNELGIAEYIFLHGKKYGAEKGAYFNNSDVFVFPTYYDCFPLVLLEAMQYSLPILSTFQGGIPSIVEDGKTGFLIPKKNGEALANAMQEVAADRDLCIQMGKAGRKRYEANFTLPLFENNLKRIMQKAISESN